MKSFLFQPSMSHRRYFNYKSLGGFLRLVVRVLREVFHWSGIDSRVLDPLVTEFSFFCFSWSAGLWIHTRTWVKRPPKRTRREGPDLSCLLRLSSDKNLSNSREIVYAISSVELYGPSQENWLSELYLCNEWRLPWVMPRNPFSVSISTLEISLRHGTFGFMSHNSPYITIILV